jgi:hypothetical protein
VTATLRELRYDEACAICGGKIEAGVKAWVDKVGPRWKRWHEFHGSDGLAQLRPPTPPEASSKGREGPPGGASSPPPVGSSDLPIYTYHRTVEIWYQGVRVGTVDNGVSRRIPISELDMDEVDMRTRRTRNLNEWGERTK